MADRATKLGKVQVVAWDEDGELMYRYEVVAHETYVVEVVATEVAGLFRIVVETRDRPVSTAATGRSTPPAAGGG